MMEDLIQKVNRLEIFVNILREQMDVIRDTIPAMADSLVNIYTQCNANTVMIIGLFLWVSILTLMILKKRTCRCRMK